MKMTSIFIPRDADEVLRIILWSLLLLTITTLLTWRFA